MPVREIGEWPRSLSRAGPGLDPLWRESSVRLTRLIHASVTNFPSSSLDIVFQIKVS